jgi:hypothetical protein
MSIGGRTMSAVSVTERALPKLREMKEESKEGSAFRVVFKGFS